MSNDEWKALALDVLRDLRGDSVFVPGSQAMAALITRTSERDLDLRSYLRTNRLNLAAFLKQFEPEIEVRIKGASDMLVGLPGAEERHVSQPRTFRKDVFDAFSKFGKTVYYDKTRDEFVADPADPSGMVAGPLITKDTIIADRRLFAEEQVEPLRSELLGAIAPGVPLSHFLKAVSSARLQKEWHRFRSLQVLARANEWSKAKGVAASPHWFKKATHSELSPRALLHGLIQQMSDEEIRDLRISVRAVESLLKYGRFQVERE